MSKPASWTAKEAGLPDWSVTALERLERIESACRPLMKQYDEIDRPGEPIDWMQVDRADLERIRRAMKGMQ